MNRLTAVRCLFVSLLLQAVLVTIVSANQESESPELTVGISPVNTYVQAQTVQTISLVSAYPFETIELTLPAVDGVREITLQKPRSQPYRIYGFDGFIYETSRVLFAQKSGRLVFEPVVINGSVLRPDGIVVPFSTASEKVVSVISPQPVEFQDDSWLAARGVQVSQEYSRALDSLRVGDTVNRLITVTARGVTAEHLPAINLRRTRYVTLFPGAEQRQTIKDSNGLSATLTQQFEILIDAENLIDFPPVTIAWWNTENDQRQLSGVPAVRIEPLPADVQALVSGLIDSASAAHKQSHRRSIYFLVAAALAGLVYLLWWVLSGLRSTAANRRLVKQAKRSGASDEFLVALQDWASPQTIDQLCAELPTDLARQVRNCERDAYGLSDADKASGVLSEIAVGIIRCCPRRNTAGRLGGKWSGRLLGRTVRLPSLE